MAEGVLVGVVVSVDVTVRVGVAVSVGEAVWLGVKVDMGEDMAAGLGWKAPQRSPPPYMAAVRTTATMSKSSTMVPKILSLAFVNGILDVPLYPVACGPASDGSYEAQSGKV